MKNTIRLIAALAALAGFADGAWARNCAGLGDLYYNDPSGKCYYLETTLTNFATAQAACMVNGGYLAHVNDAAENALIRTQFSGNGNVMIGGRDLANNNYWVWDEGELKGQAFWSGNQLGAPVNSMYTNWSGGNPNSPAQDCMHLNTGTGNWDDLDCAVSTNPYVCEVYACRNPLGDQGEVIFNQDSRTLQYCNGVSWVAMAQPAYKPVAVTFDGANDYATNTSPFSGIADSKMLTGSLWVKLNSLATQQRILAQQAGGLNILYSNAGSRLEVIGRDSGGTIIIQMRCGGAVPVTGQWYHMLFSVDLSDVNKRHCYISDSASASFLTYTDSVMNFDDVNGTRIGAANDGPASLKFNGSLADLWLDFGTYIDLSVVGNRRKFISASGAPVDLGSTGALPTGTPPEVFLSGAVGAWHTNKGTGGGFTLTGALAADNPPGALAGQDITTGLVGYWTFDDPSGSTEAANSVGGGLPGVLTSMTPAADWVTGKIGGALDFDGTNDRVVVQPHDAINNLSPVTWCAWIYPRSLPGGSFPVLVDKSTNVSGSDGFNFYLEGTTGNLGYYSNLGDYKQRGPSMTLNTWQHVCATWDGSNSTANILLYRNGVLSNTGGGVGDTAVSSNDALVPLEIGGAPNASQYLNGLMDDLRVYNRVLSPTEILSLYAWGENGGSYCSNPVRSPGTIIYNDVSNVPQFCDGGTWRALGPVPGPGGAGCSNPSRGEGHILFNSASRTMQYCDGVTWRAMPGMGVAAPTAGLVHHWPMEDGAAAVTIDDVVGNNDCTVVNNGGSRASVVGKSGNALHYQGSYANCGTVNALYSVSQFTMSTWIRRHASLSTVAVGQMDNAQTNTIVLNFWDDGDAFFSMTAPPSGDWEEAYITLNDTNWHLLTMVYDGTQTGNSNRLKAYINGQPAAVTYSGTIAATTPTLANASDFMLFRYSSTGTREGYGYIDDVRIYNRPLSAEEVSQLYFATGGQ